MTTQHQTPEEIAALKKEQADKTLITSTMNFLMMLVDRDGGEIIIENLSEFAGKRLGITLFVDEENDRVILKTAERVESKGGPK